MTKKKWLFLVLIIAAVFGCIKLFYKTYSKEVVAKSADSILVLDVKRITNTIIWNTITTPGQWKIGKLFSRSKKKTSWKDMIEIPDYVMAFHSKDQPEGIWYLVLDIKDEEGFEEGLQQYHFVRTGNGEYVEKANNIRILKNNGRLLVATGASKNEEYFRKIADEVFVQKKYAADEMIQKAIGAKSHLALQINPNSLLAEDGLLTVNFNKEEIKLEGTFTPKPAYLSQETGFNVDPGALYSFGVVQPTPALYDLWSDSSRQKMSKLCNFNIDSFFIRSNHAYQLQLQGFVSRTDSAITYTFDDDFNKVENVVVNEVNEPAFDLAIYGDSVQQVYGHFQQRKTVEETRAGNLFTAFPFAKSYITVLNKELHIRSVYKPAANTETMQCIFFMNILTGNITSDMWRFTPDAISKVLANIESIKLLATRSGKKLIVHGSVKKKKNDVPIIKI